MGSCSQLSLSLREAGIHLVFPVSREMDRGEMFCREIELSDDEDGLVVKVAQVPEGDTGVVVWDAAIVLAKYLQTVQAQLKSRSVIELGSGTGAVGLSAAALGASPVILTDLSALEKLIQHNISLNSSVISRDKCTVAPLVWGDKEQGEQAIKETGGQPDFILLSDCVFYSESVPPLVESLTQLAGPSTNLLLSYEERQSQQKVDTMKQFFHLMSKKFTWAKLPLESHHPEFRSEDIQIFKFQTKKMEEIES